jgi:hypothetical protein
MSPELVPLAGLVGVEDLAVDDGVAQGALGADGLFSTATLAKPCYEWGFNPREIQATNVCIWHAQDDNTCPPEPGQWLADFLASRDGVQANFRDEDEGCGHLTFCRGQYALPETSMIAAMLLGRSQD